MTFAYRTPNAGVAGSETRMLTGWGASGIQGTLPSNGFISGVVWSHLLACDLPIRALAPIVVTYKADFTLRKSVIVFDAKGGGGRQWGMILL